MVVIEDVICPNNQKKEQKNNKMAEFSDFLSAPFLLIFLQNAIGRKSPDQEDEEEEEEKEEEEEMEVEVEELLRLAAICPTDQSTGCDTDCHFPANCSLTD